MLAGAVAAALVIVLPSSPVIDELTNPNNLQPRAATQDAVASVALFPSPVVLGLTYVLGAAAGFATCLGLVSALLVRTGDDRRRRTLRLLARWLPGIAVAAVAAAVGAAVPFGFSQRMSTALISGAVALAAFAAGVAAVRAAAVRGH